MKQQIPGTWIICLALAMPAGSALAQAGSGEGVLAAEATVYQDTPDLNGGGYAQICAGNIATMTETRRGYVRYDLPAIPQGATVTRVQLNFRQVRVRFRGAGAPKTATLQIRRVTSAWTEGAGGGNNAACGGGSSAPGVTWNGAPSVAETDSGSEALPSSDNFSFSFDTDAGSDDDGLISDVQAWVDGTAANNGWRVRIAEETTIDNARLIEPGTLTVSWETASTPGITVDPTGGLVTTEAGGADQFTVVLDSQPSADVTIGLSSSDASEGTVAPASLTFTAADWDMAQVVTVTGVDDAAYDGDVAYSIVTGPAASADGGYDGLDAAEVAVTNVGDEPLVTINAGLNDAWFNVATAGQGFFFTVFPDIEAFFLSWFTFDLELPPEDVLATLGDAGHRWLTAFGGWSGNVVTLNVELTTGGVFDSPEPMVTQDTQYGTITIVFHDCFNATLTYDIPSLALAGTIPLTRITADNVPLCQALSDPP